MILFLTAAFALGAIVASFIGVIVARLNTGQGFIAGRSRCDLCDAPLPPSALVPIFSYLAGGARTRCCGARLPLTALISEVALGALFAGAYWTLGSTPALIPFLVALSLLAALVLYDLAHQILPPVLLALFVAAGAGAGFFAAPSLDAFLGTLPAALLISAFLALVHGVSRGRALGFSDAPLALGLALLVGPAALPGFVFSFWIGAVVGIVILLGRPAGSRMRIEVPFAPFLAAGFLLAYFTQWNPFVFLAGFMQH